MNSQNVKVKSFFRFLDTFSPIRSFKNNYLQLNFNKNLNEQHSKNRTCSKNCHKIEK